MKPSWLELTDSERWFVLSVVALFLVGVVAKSFIQREDTETRQVQMGQLQESKIVTTP